MKDNKIQIIIAYLFHVVFILLELLFMKKECFTLVKGFTIAGILYWSYWIWLNRKGYMPWIVYLNFFAVSTLNLILNWAEIIPADEGFFPGLGRAIFGLFVLGHVALIGLTNFVLWLIDKKRQKR